MFWPYESTWLPGKVPAPLEGTNYGVDKWGTIRQSITLGRSIHGIGSAVRGEYVTEVLNNDWSVLKSQHTIGKTYVDDSIPYSDGETGNPILIKPNVGGEYETLAGINPATAKDPDPAWWLVIPAPMEDTIYGVDKWGTVKQSITVGNSRHGIGGPIVGEYMTESKNNDWGILEHQKTLGPTIFWIPPT
jgi:hypothetical protein